MGKDRRRGRLSGRENDPLDFGQPSMRVAAHGERAERFSDLRFLGRGGMGEVYSAYDEKLNVRVALKRLVSTKPNAISRFKREFRTLSLIIHPNLVRLHEFFELNGQYFFTMDLVDGVSFLDYVGSDHHEPGAGSFRETQQSDSSGLSGGREDGSQETLPSDSEAASGRREHNFHDTRPADSEALSGHREDDSQDRLPSDPRTSSVRGLSSPGVVRPDYDVGRLSRSLTSLVHGLMALHEAGVIHRDIKPSNIIVSPEGHLVILDFGLAIQEGVESSLSAERRDFVGTVSYMAPEQAVNKPLTPAADWYSVGVLLYRALTGRYPYEGSILQVLVDKQRREPPPTSQVTEGVPGDLDALCVDLLRVEPDQRPSGWEILMRLGMVTPSRPRASFRHASTATKTRSPFLGRQSEMAVLRQVWGEVESSRPKSVVIYGQSGVGKTRLMEEFAREVMQTDSDTLVFKSRCYEKETVPFKVMDGIMEGISRRLQSMPDREVAALLPLHAGLLMQAFPVLRRLSVLAEREVEEVNKSPHEQRKRLFEALREFFIRLTRNRSVVLLIDDLQWADTDSEAMLNSLLLPPEAPGLLLVATYRADKGEEVRIPGDLRDIRIHELQQGDARDLARQLFRNEHVRSNVELIENIVQESRGHPLFISELVRYVLSDSRGRNESPGLDDVLWHRVSELDAPTQQLLHLICVSGKPTPLGLLKAATGMIISTMDRHLDVLRAEQLIRTRKVRGVMVVEPYHNRIRESVISHLSASARRMFHRHLAVALQDTANPDLEALVDHWLAAGSPKRAAYFARRAGDHAMQSFAFEQAVYFYKFALDHDQSNDLRHRSKLNHLLGIALANAGRGKEAADSYLRAIEGAPEEARFDLRRLAAGQLLRSGYMEQGLETLEQVMAEAGIEYHKTTGSVILAFLWTRLRLKFMRSKIRLRDRANVPKNTIRRLDTYWDTAMCFAMVDTFRGSYYSSRLVVEALKAGLDEPLSMALALESDYISSYGLSHRGEAGILLGKAQTLAERTNKPEALFWATLATFAYHVLMGEFQTAYQLYPMLEMLLGKCKDMFWEKSTAEVWVTWSICHTGKFRELQQRLPRSLLDAEMRGDRYAVTNLTLGLGNLYWLLRDDPETGIRVSNEVLERWDRRSFELQDYYHMLSVSQAMLYQGRSPYRLIESKWKALRRAQLLRVQLVNIEALHLRGRAALVEGALDEAVSHAKKILKSRETWGYPLARLLLAGVAATRGDEEEAVRILTDIRDAFRDNVMEQYVAVTNWQLGGLIGGDEGQVLRAEAEGWAASQEVKNWPRFANMLAPGFGKQAR